VQHPADPLVAGALGALVVELARRTGAESALRASTEPPTTNRELSLQITVALGGKPYDLGVTLNGDWQPTGALATPALRDLGELPITLPLIWTITSIDPAELALLEPGDALFPGAARELGGSAVLAGPCAEWGLAVTLTETGGLVLRGERVALAVDGGAHMPEPEGDAAVPELVSRTALEAPIVVRVELGSVTLLAREWAELKAGDVIETGRRIAEPVILRVAGQEVAHGELVNVDGELGVRIHTLLTRGTP